VAERNPWDDVWSSIPTGGRLHRAGERLARWGDLKRLILEEVSGFVSQGSRVLEAGCGTGTVMRPLARKGALVTGVDLSFQALRRARSPACILSAARIQELPFPDGIFDLVYSAGVFDLLTREDLDAAVKEAVRVTAPGGSLVLVCAAPCSLHRAVMGYLARRNRWRYGPKKEVSSLREQVMKHSPGAEVEERGRGFLLRFMCLAYPVEHMALLRRIVHGAVLLVSGLFWPVNRLPGMILVTRATLPPEGAG
jgi:SAM-dependent methyltransferase